MKFLNILEDGAHSNICWHSFSFHSTSSLVMCCSPPSWPCSPRRTGAWYQSWPTSQEKRGNYWPFLQTQRLQGNSASAVSMWWSGARLEVTLFFLVDEKAHFQILSSNISQRDPSWSVGKCTDGWEYEIEDYHKSITTDFDCMVLLTGFVMTHFLT